MIEIHSSEIYRGQGYSTTKTFEHIPENFWGLHISQGCTSKGTQVCKASVYYSQAELFRLFIYKDDPFFVQLKELRKTRNVEPTQETIKIAEELMRYSFQKMLEQPNFGSKIGFLYDKLYRSGVEHGRDSIQSEIKKILDL